MEDRVSSVQDDIQEIKNILINGQQNREIPVQPATAMTYAQKVKSSDSVIIIKKNEHDQAIDRNTITEAAVSSRAGISSAYENKQGHMVVVCESEAAKQRLTSNLKEKVKDREIITPAPRQPTIRITGMEENHSTNTVFELARDLNVDKGIHIDEDNFKVLFVRPHAKNAKLFQAVVRVSNEIRVAIKNASDKLFVGLTLCPIFNHLHIKRCNKCQKYNHFKDKCENEATCGKCAGSHETEACTNDQVKCTNCAENKYTDTNHLASDPHCKSYVAAQKKLEQTIGFYKEKN